MKKYYSLIIVVILSLHFNAYAQLLKSPPPVPSDHPRVLIRPSDLYEIKRKKELPEFQSLWSDIKNSSQPVCLALTYLLEGDKVKGKQAISDAYSALQKTNDDGLRFMNAVFLAACVYDWCYNLMTSSERQAFIKEFARIHNLHPPYWPARPNFDAIVSHNSSGWFFNQLFAGLAIYDEDPKIWEQASKIFFDNYQEVRNFAFKSHMSHQGWYMSTRWNHVLMTGFLFRSLSDGKDVWINDFEKTGDMLLYFMRPDQQIMRIGDTGVDSWEHEFNNVYIDGLASYYKNPYFAHIGDLNIFKSYNSLRDDLFVKFLLRPANLPRKKLNELPLTKYFPEPVGAEMVARTGWDMSGNSSNDAIIDMRIGQYYFGAHQHKDFGTFQIYYKGNLTGDSGMYKGSSSGASSDHWKNYYRSTTAHNGLIIYDPKETYGGGNWTNTFVDGGARWPYNNDVQPNFMSDLINPANGYQYGSVIAHEFGPDQQTPEYNYISGDITPGYIGKSGTGYTTRAKKVTRSMVTFNTQHSLYPAIFVVFDRIESTNKDFRKAFLLHSIKRPEVNNSKTVLKRGDGLNGKLVSYTLLPSNPSISIVEDYKINGQTFDPGKKAATSKYEDMKWRIEVSPKEKNLEDFFLHAMIVMDAPVVEPTAEAIQNGNLIGTKVLDHIAMFSKSGELISQAEFDAEDEKNNLLKILICDVVPGKWKVFVDDIEVATPVATIEGQTIYFSTQPGKIRIQLEEEAFTKVP